MTDAVKQSTLTELDSDAKEAAAIEDELADTRREEQLGRDLARVGDNGLATSRELRKKVTAAQSAENRVLSGFASASHDPSKSAALAALGNRAAQLAEQLDQTDGQIEGMVGNALNDARGLSSVTRPSSRASRRSSPMTRPRRAARAAT